MEQAFHEEEEVKAGSGFDIKRVFVKIKKNILWIIGSLILFSAGAFFYLKYTLPLYKVSTYILIKPPSKAEDLIGGSAFGASGGGTSRAATDMGNEIFKLKSESLIGGVVDSLNLNINIKKVVGSVKQHIDLENLPVAVSLKKSPVASQKKKYKLHILRSFYKLESDDANINGVYNQPLVIGYDTIVVTSKGVIQKPSEYELEILSRNEAIGQYASRISVAPVPNGGEGMMEVSVKDEVPERGQKFINLLVKNYDEANLNFNTQAIKSEMKFLNDRLAVVTEELDKQARLVRDFKTSNQVFDVSASASQLLGTLPQIDTKKADNLVKEELLGYVERNVKSYNGQDDIVPNSGGLQDPVLADQINKYNQLVLQKRNVLDNGAPQDPRLPSINGQMEQLRTNILKNVQNIRGEIKANYNSLATQERKISGQFSTIPEKEKEFIDLNRVLTIKQALYNFLLQKREDKNMELAASQIQESRIVDNKSSFTKFPNALYIYGIGAGIGLVLPIIILLAQVLFNDKIESRQDIESATTLPIVGEIAKSKDKESELVITIDSVTPESEQFRTLRTNISYMTHGSKQTTLLITSSRSEEGKSFISLNIANSLAIAGKKTVLLEFDLRRPGLSEKIGISETTGLANYLNGEVDIEDILQPMSTSENLFFISSGFPLPPNPGELILDTRMKELFVYLKSNFDMIVLDSPPVGPVSDALTLGKWADLAFYVVRHRFTLRSAIKLLNKLNIEQKIPRPSIIVNGIEDGKEFSYGNDYGYGYGYGYGYNEKKKSKKNKKVLLQSFK